MYSSRAIPGAPVDRFSDYDLLLAVTDVPAWHARDSWLEDYGPVLAIYRNPLAQAHGFESFAFITLYENGVKIDYSFFPAAYLRWVAAQPRLPDDLDNGFQALVDKDGLTSGWPAPTHTAYLPAPPTLQEYHAVIEEFFNDATYVAKCLYRGDLFQAKYCFDKVMKFDCLRKMLEWQVAIQSGWSVPPGAYGKGLQTRVRPELWAALERTYVGAGWQESWDALFETIHLFRAVAVEVGEQLGFRYLDARDRKVCDYLVEVKEGYLLEERGKK